MLDLSRPINLASEDFARNKFAYFERLREESPVHSVKISVLTIYAVSRYEDCTAILKDPRVVRNRSTATGGGRAPFPLPKSLQAMMSSMIVEDDPNHRRLRDLVRRAFRPQAIASLESDIEAYSHELLDRLPTRTAFDLQSDYALPIPVRMISRMLGVRADDMPMFQGYMKSLTSGFSGWRLLRTLFRDLPRATGFVSDLIDTKRAHPGDDILTALLEPDETGDRLSHDELVAMVFLLVVAGFETTVHLITNGIHTLLTHPAELDRLRAEPSLIDSAVEEILRHRGPVQSTKPGYALEPIEMRGVTIPKGKPIMPLFGAANHDPRVFESPQTFDISRDPNRHLGFGHGVHFCLGAHLARLETRIAIQNLLARAPELQLAVHPDSLVPQAMPGWHRYDGLPIRMGAVRAAA